MLKILKYLFQSVIFLISFYVFLFIFALVSPNALELFADFFGEVSYFKIWAPLLGEAFKNNTVNSSFDLWTSAFAEAFLTGFCIFLLVFVIEKIFNVDKLNKVFEMWLGILGTVIGVLIIYYFGSIVKPLALIVLVVIILFLLFFLIVKVLSYIIKVPFINKFLDYFSNEESKSNKLVVNILKLIISSILAVILVVFTLVFRLSLKGDIDLARVAIVIVVTFIAFALFSYIDYEKKKI